MQLCLIKDAIDVYKATIELIKIAKTLVYRDSRYSQEYEGIPSNVDVLKKYYKSHTTRKHVCSNYGLRMINGVSKVYTTRDYLGRSTSAQVQLSTQLVYGNARYGIRYNSNNKR